MQSVIKREWGWLHYQTKQICTLENGQNGKLNDIYFYHTLKKILEKKGM